MKIRVIINQLSKKKLEFRVRVEWKKEKSSSMYTLQRLLLVGREGRDQLGISLLGAIKAMQYPFLEGYFIDKRD